MTSANCHPWALLADRYFVLLFGKQPIDNKSRRGTPSGDNISCACDTSGNIATYTAPDGEVITYTYDGQGQLLKAEGDQTYTYTYDDAGNILTANGHTYTYGDSTWKDLLTAFDNGTISYDKSGNPTSYYNGTRRTFGWTNGRSLISATDGETEISYVYDKDGLRTSKTVDGVVHNYIYASGKPLPPVMTITGRLFKTSEE